MGKMINKDHLKNTMTRPDLRERFHDLMQILYTDCTPENCNNCPHIRAGDFDSWDCHLLFPMRGVKSLNTPVCTKADWRQAAQIGFVSLMDEYDKFKEAADILTAIGKYIGR